MILVDTSVWVSHFRAADIHLGQLLQNGEVVCHPMVVGELACGNLRNRAAILTLLQALPSAVAAEPKEILAFIAKHRLMGRGLGYIDMALLASALLTGIPLWTLDKRLGETATLLHSSWLP